MKHVNMLLLMVTILLGSVGCSLRQRVVDPAHESAGQMLAATRVLIGEAVKAVERAKVEGILTEKEYNNCQDLVIQCVMRYNNAVGYYETTGSLFQGDIEAIIEVANAVIRRIEAAERSK